MAELALDLGTKMGFCIRTKRGDFFTGCVDLSDDAETQFSKFGKFEEIVGDFLEVYGVEKIYYESVDFGQNTYAMQVYGGFKSSLHKMAEQKGIDIEGFAVPTVKKSLTGRGNATKQGMIYYAEKYVDREITNDNEADAIGVMHTGRGGRR